MTGYFDSDQSAIGRIRARSSAAAYRAGFTPPVDFERSMAAYVNAYPNADPKVLFSFAMSGQDPTSDAVQKAMEASADSNRHKNAFDMLGDVVGAVTHPVGAVLGAGARLADAAMGPVDEHVLPAAQGAVRTGFVVLESPLQEVQTFLRAGLYTGLSGTAGRNPVQAFGAAYQQAGSSSLREALSDFGERPIDLGHGYLPGGKVEERVKTKANQLILKFGDHQLGGPGNPSISLGRVAAASVTEPGTGPFNIISGLVDAGVAWYGDPVAAFGAAAKEAEAGARLGRAGRVLRDEGLRAAVTELATKPSFVDVVDRSAQGHALDAITGRIRSIRKTVLPDVADAWLSKGGRRVVERIAATDNFVDLHRALGPDVPARLKLALVDAKTPQEVMDILRPEIGVALRDSPQYLGYKVSAGDKRGVRLLAAMPGSHIDPTNLDDAVEQIDRVMRNAKATPELRRSAIERVAHNTDRQTMVSTLGDVMGDLADELAGTVKGRDGFSSRNRARSLTKLYSRDLEAVTAYFTKEVTDNAAAIGVKVGDNAFPASKPFLYTEYLNSLVPLPDARELRRATSGLSSFVDTPWFERAVHALDAGNSTWKRLTLLRGAYTVRVVGEEQLRMAAAGMDSAFAHPLSFISGLVADDGKLGKLVRNSGRRSVDATGSGFYNDLGEPITHLQQAMNQGQFAHWVDQKRLVSDEWKIFNRGDEGYTRALADGIGEMHRDPIARVVAQANGNLDHVVDQVWEGSLRNVRKDMVGVHPVLATRDGVDRYVNYLWEGMQYRTANDPVLMEAIATGHMDGQALGAFKARNGADRFTWSRNPALMDHLDSIAGPAAVKGRNPDVMLDRVGIFDNATSWAFDHLATKPTNFLSRSQTFKQRYWQRVTEMVPFATPEVRAELLDNARKSLLPADQIARIEKATANATTPLAKIDDLDQVAKHWALHETKDLLYDLSERGQFFDAFRLVFPFGEAWKEVLTRWAKIGTENPKVFRRAQQVITGARGADPDGDGRGFFYKDSNGQEVFSYPFSRQLSKMAIGMPVELTGRVGGLSLMTDITPGVGPIIQIPAAAVVPDTPDWDFARGFLFPFGQTDYSQGFLEAMAPGYLRNVAQYFHKGDPRAFANTVMAIADQLASEGGYDLSLPSDQARLVQDARAMAPKLYGLRGMAQFVSPTAPYPETLLKVGGKEGHEYAIRREVVKDLRRLQDEAVKGGGTRADGVDLFVQRYGTDFLRFTQGMTTGINPYQPSSNKSAIWERGHKGVVDDYGLVWGLFAPADDSEAFNQAAYSRQIQRGTRKPLTPEQRQMEANAAVGRYLYDQALKRVSDQPTKVEREWLAQAKDLIRAQYPGYGRTVPGMPVRADLDKDVVPELYQAINDKRLRNTRQAKAASLYLSARTRALAFAAEVGVKSLDAQAADPARAWLGVAAKKILAEYPEFQPFFDATFSRELDN